MLVKRVPYICNVFLKRKIISFQFKPRQDIVENLIMESSNGNISMNKIDLIPHETVSR